MIVFEMQRLGYIVWILSNVNIMLITVSNVQLNIKRKIHVKIIVFLQIIWNSFKRMPLTMEKLKIDTWKL